MKKLLKLILLFSVIGCSPIYYNGDGIWVRSKKITVSGTYKYKCIDSCGRRFIMYSTKEWNVRDTVFLNYHHD